MAIKSIIATVKGEQVKLELSPETGYYERAWGSGADSSTATGIGIIYNET